MLRTGFLAAALLLVTAVPARAEVIVAGTGEPAFTNSANNTQWFEWSNSTPAYRVEFLHSVDNGATVVDGPYEVANRGSTSVNWTGIRGVSVPLAEGSTYRVCGFGRWRDASNLWYPDFTTSCGTAGTKGVATTIDRTPPAIAVTAPAVTRTAEVPFTIAYEDALAYPFGVAFVGVDSATMRVLPGCAPADPKARSTTFACSVDVPGTDGPHAICAQVPDASIPDNPNSSDQSGTAASANRSATKCATVVLDATAPQVSLSGPATVVAGQPATFAAQVTDPTSGLRAGTDRWSFGDGATAGGYEATRTYAAAGTYTVTFTVADAAGNTATAARTVEVTPAPQQQPQPVPGPGPAPQPGPGPAPQPDAGALSLAVEGVAGRGKRRVLRLAVSDQAGAARVVLRRGLRIVVTKRLAIRGGTLAVPLPRTLVAGRHEVRVTVGGRTATASVKLGGARVKAAAARATIDPRGLRPALP